MILCLDVGNSQIYGGVYIDDQLQFTFRRNSKSGASSDEIGIFLRGVLRENELDHKEVQKISICTVVPEILYSLTSACKKYFNVTPFVLQAGVKTGLKIKYRNPLEVGADRIANAIAATSIFPNEDLIVVDFGTATTFCTINKEKEYLGGVIMAGLKLHMSSLEQGTSKLPSVEIIEPKNIMGRSTVESIQAGIFFGALGTAKEVISQISNEVFNGKKPRVIATGGFAHLFENYNVYDNQIKDLVHQGLFTALKMNT